jgi:Tol biopolymer transport system component
MMNTSTTPSTWPLRLVMCLALCATGLQANAAEKVTQLTSPDSGCSYFKPQLSKNGRWVIAISLCTRETEDHQQVPDHQVVRIERDTGAIQILTPPGVESGTVSVSGNGELVAFTSDGDLVRGQNPGRIPQIFLFDAGRHRYTQVTHIMASDRHRGLLSLGLSSSGEVLFFVSNADLVAGENNDGNPEMFIYTVNTGTLMQATHTEDPAKHLSFALSKDAQTVAFVGAQPPFGNRAVVGLYVWDRKTGVVERLLETLNPDASAFMELTMSEEATRFVFSGKYDFVGENADRNTELFLFDRTRGFARQLTHTRGCTSAHPTLSSDGRRVLFISDCRFGKINELLYTNLFLMRLDTDEVIQITDSGVSAPVQPPTMDASERLVALAFGGELKGMVNPKSLIQIAIVDVPVIGPVEDIPPPLLSAQDVSTFLPSRHDPDVSYVAGSSFGVMKSENGGRSWRLASFGLGSEHVVSLVEHPEKPKIVFAGTSDLGVYKTSTAGYIWMPANVGLSDHRILGLAVDTAFPDVIYADTPSGLYRSDDQGQNWDHLTGPPVAAQHEAALVSLPEHPLNSSAGKLVAVTGKSGRLLRLSAHGLFLLPRDAAEWVQVKTPHAPEWVTVGPNGALWFIGTAQGVYYTESSGGEWTLVSGLPETSVPPITFAPADTAYAVARDGFYGSRNRGLTWARLGDLGGVSQLTPAVSPSGVVLSGFHNGSLKMSRDGGEQWIPFSIPTPSHEGLESVLFRPAR